MTDLEKAAFDLGEAIANFVRQAAMIQQAPGPDGAKLYSTEDLSELLGKSKDTIRRWIANGEFGEPVHVGKSVRVTQAGLDKYLTDHSGPLQKQETAARRKAGAKAASDLAAMRL